MSLLLISASLLPAISSAHSEKDDAVEKTTDEPLIEVISNGEVTLEKKHGRVFDKNDGAEIVSVTGYNEDGTPVNIPVDEYFESIKALLGWES